MEAVREMVQAIGTYRGEHHVLPSTLHDLATAESDPVRLTDAWGGPFQYRTDGARYRLFSYGRDRLPGGVGLDYDLSSDGLPSKVPPAGSSGAALPDKARPTFRQFVDDTGGYGFETAGSGQDMFLTCLAAGAVACLLAFVAIGLGSRSRGGLVLRGTCLLTTLAGAVLVGALVAGLHVPQITH